jgi:ZU5 domain-containing protein
LIAGDQMKSKRLNISQLAIITAAAIVVACGGEQALLVSPSVPGAPPLGVVQSPGGAIVRPIRRQQPMAAEVSWSFDVDARGTTVRHPATGLTITVPAGAVTAPTHITVYALRGAPLAYRFEPHGLQFAQPIQLTQSLHGLLLGAASQPIPRLLGGYFADDSLDTDAATGNASVIEILPVQIDVRGHNAVLSIRHFSGYTVASAASDSLPDRHLSWDLR